MLTLLKYFIVNNYALSTKAARICDWERIILWLNCDLFPLKVLI